jgi:hypothetical protein
MRPFCSLSSVQCLAAMPASLRSSCIRKPGGLAPPDMAKSSSACPGRSGFEVFPSGSGADIGAARRLMGTTAPSQGRTGMREEKSMLAGFVPPRRLLEFTFTSTLCGGFSSMTPSTQHAHLSGWGGVGWGPGKSRRCFAVAFWGRGLELVSLCCMETLQGCPANRPLGVTVSTLDSESSARGSNPREAFFESFLGVAVVSQPETPDVAVYRPARIVEVLQSSLQAAWYHGVFRRRSDISNLAPASSA